MAPLDPGTIRLHRSGRGTPLVMLHCLGITRHLWDCLGGLADSYELISYDLPGHGETPVPAAPYGIEELSAQSPHGTERWLSRECAVIATLAKPALARARGSNLGPVAHRDRDCRVASLLAMTVDPRVRRSPDCVCASARPIVQSTPAGSISIVAAAPRSSSCHSRTDDRRRHAARQQRGRDRLEHPRPDLQAAAGDREQLLLARAVAARHLRAAAHPSDAGRVHLRVRRDVSIWCWTVSPPTHRPAT